MDRIRNAKVLSPTDYHDNHHEAHDHWQEYWNHPQDLPNFWGWNPRHGESHVVYSIGMNPATRMWGVTHHGFYHGVQEPDEDGSFFGILPPSEKGFADLKINRDGTPDRVGPTDPTTRGTWEIGPFRDQEGAKGAAEKHFADNYGNSGHGLGDYDINQVMRDEGFQ